MRISDWSSDVCSSDLKVTIIPRGRALGVTMNLPEADRYSLKFREITAKLAMMFGGRVAEEVIYGAENVSTGASNDIQQATNLARRMVTEWGMSEKIGRLRSGDKQCTEEHTSEIQTLMRI